MRALGLAFSLALGAPGVFAQTWNFDVRLDGKPIGSHRFTVDGPPESREVLSAARFEVKLLGITVYRYRHEASERWRGDCLQDLHSRTDDDGKALEIDRRADEEGNSTCLMSYAYWNPRLLQQQRLLNPQTGEIDELRVERLPDAVIPVSGRDVEASRWRLSAKSAGAKQEITVWRDRRDGRWIGLDAEVKGGRVLSYRLP